MAKKKPNEPAVRKSFLIFGGIIVGVAVLGFVVSTFVLGGGGGSEEPTSSAPPAASSNPAAVPGTNGVPATGTNSGKFPKNELKPGGRNPFTAAVAGRAAPADTTVVATAATSPDEQTKAHSWQLLDLKDGEATILVDGKKKVVKVGEEVIKGYKFNSVTGQCITIKGPSVFGLCQGAQPITA